MNRRGFSLAIAVAGVSLTAPVLTGANEVAAGRRKRNRGGSAYARAAVTGSGGRVSVSVNCGSNRQSSAAGHGGHGSQDGHDGQEGGDGQDGQNGQGDGMAVDARC